MYIFVAKLSYKRRIITGTCTDSVKLIVFVFSKKHFHEIQPRKIYTGTAVYFYAVSGFVVFTVAHSRLHVTQGKHHTQYTSTLYATP